MKKLWHDDYEVAEAIAVARAELQLAVSKGIFSGKLTPSNIWIISCEMTAGEPKFCYDDERFSYDDARAKFVIGKAVDGDVEADAALRKIAQGKLQKGSPLPPNLAQYIDSLLADDRKPPDRRGHPSKFARNLFVHAAVETIKRRGFAVTRNDSSAEYRASASSIVSSALDELGVTLSEKAVAGIWLQIHRSSVLNNKDF
jgi:hypothetical protein